MALVKPDTSRLAKIKVIAVGGGDDLTSTEFVEYAPDLILNLPPELMRDNPVWEEVAP
ncbi:MAG: hypothetical protein HY376_01065 [Candidatus Blackburnbacteria bacterium]|nr:hypothetical protein [Candidatus Blackburnbacteria bacterium]